LKQRGKKAESVIRTEYVDKALSDYSDYIAEVFGEIKYQSYQFHIIKEITKDILKAFTQVRKRLPNVILIFGFPLNFLRCNTGIDCLSGISPRRRSQGMRRRCRRVGCQFEVWSS
jgi:hypothetical protein